MSNQSIQIIKDLLKFYKSENFSEVKVSGLIRYRKDKI